MRRHPYTSLREYARCLQAVAQAARDLTPSIFCDRLANRKAVSITQTLGDDAESTWHLRLAFGREGLVFRAGRRADATTLVYFSLDFQ